MSATRVCHDCLKNYRRKNKGAQKPWPKYLHHEGHDRLCEYHRAKAAEYSSVAKGKRALRKVAWSDSAKINTVYREAAKRRASGEKYMSIMKFLCAGRTSADYMSITT